MRGRAGFTLLEMLVVLALVGFLTVGVTGGVGFGLRGWNRVLHATTELSELEISRRVLRGKLGGLVPKNADFGQAFFKGNGREMMFFAPPPLSLGAGLMRYRLVIDPRADGRQTLHLYGQNDLVNDRDDWGDPALLLDGAVAVDFAYYGRRGPGAVPSWGDDWDAPREGPLLIRISVRFMPEDDVVWPDLLVTPVIAQDASCQYDLGLSACRGR